MEVETPYKWPHEYRFHLAHFTLQGPPLFSIYKHRFWGPPCTSFRVFSFHGTLNCLDFMCGSPACPKKGVSEPLRSAGRNKGASDPRRSPITDPDLRTVYLPNTNVPWKQKQTIHGSVIYTHNVPWIRWWITANCCVSQLAWNRSLSFRGVSDRQSRLESAMTFPETNQNAPKKWVQSPKGKSSSYSFAIHFQVQTCC